MNLALSTFAAWPKIVHGRVIFTAACPCGLDARWEQIGQAGADTYEISCACTRPLGESFDEALREPVDEPVLPAVVGL